MSGDVGSLIRKALLGAPLEAAKRLVLGGADERALVPAFVSAIPTAAKMALPECVSAGEVDDLVNAMLELISTEAIAAATAKDAGSVSAAFAAVLERQLVGLFETSEGTSYAEDRGLTVDLGGLVELLLDQAAVGVAFELTPASTLAREFRAERAMRVGSGVVAPDVGVEVRYLIATSLSAITDIVNKRFENLPFRADLLFENEVSRLWRQVADHYGDDRDTAVDTGGYRSLEDYMTAHPDAEPAADPYVGFSTTRAPSASDIVEIGNSDLITELLAGEGIAPQLLVSLSAWEGSCGDPGDLPFREWAALRPMWGLLLQVSVSGKTALTSLSGPSWGSGLAALAERRMEPEQRVDLPPAPLEADQCVLIPLATLIPPVQARPTWSLTLRTHQAAEYAVAAETIVGIDCPLETWGPGLLPSALSTGENAVVLRPFDPDLTYSADKSWQIGSCPHLFALDSSGRPSYLGAAFGRWPGREQTEGLVMNDDTTCLEIVELEDEATFLRRVSIDSTIVAEGVWLGPGESIRLAVQPGQRVVLTGYYVSHPSAVQHRDPFRRAECVRTHLDELGLDAALPLRWPRLTRD